MSSWMFVINYFIIQSVNSIYAIKSSAESDVISKYVPIHEFGYARPIIDPNRAVTVYMNFELRDILEVSTTTQRIKVRGYIRMEWQNEWLNWNSTNEKNIQSINLDPSSAWTPEIVAYTSARSTPVGEEDDDDDKENWTSKSIKTKLKIDSNGTTTWLSPIYLESTCKFRLSKFPNDEQVCEMVFGTWADTIETVKLEDLKLPVLKDGFRQNAEWELKDATSGVTEVHYQCCKLPISRYEIKLRLRRKSKYYIFHYILPVVFMILTLLMANFVPLESSERFTLLLLIFLTAALMLLLTVKTILPHTDEISLMSKLYVLLLFDIFLSIMATSFVAIFHFNTANLLWFPKWLETRYLPKHLWRDEIRKATENNDSIDQLSSLLKSQNANERFLKKEEGLQEVLRLLSEYNNSQYDEAKNERVEMRSRMLAAFLDKISFGLLFIFSLIVLSVIVF